MEFSQQNTEQKVSKYNEGIAEIMRLNNIWQSAHLYSTSGNLMRWNSILDSAWRELGADSNEKEFKEFYKFNRYIRKWRHDREKLNSILELKELFLRKLQNRQGKGTKYYDPMEDELEE